MLLGLDRRARTASTGGRSPLGAASGSALWFTALGYGARLLRPVFARPAAWRVLDGGIAVVMSPSPSPWQFAA